MTLFHLLHGIRDEYQLKLVPVHINHLLREEAADESTCLSRMLKERYGSKLIVLSANVADMAKKRGLGIEECGREVRKTIFNLLSEKIGANKIALGHNRDDQTETLLFRMARGTGIRGLCGMRYKSGKYIRPLLFANKSTIRAFAEREGIFFIEDRTNYELCYDRNVLRHKVLPLLNQINEKASNHIAELAFHCQEVIDFVYDLVRSHISANLIYKGTDMIVVNASLLDLSPFLAKEVLRALYEEFVGTIAGISRFHVGKFLEEAGEKRNVCLQFPKGLIFIKSASILLIVKKGFNKPPFDLPIDRAEIGLPHELGSIYIEGDRTVFDGFVVRGFRDGDRYKGKRLKDILYNAGIPMALRSLVPLVAKGREVYFLPLLDGKDFFYRGAKITFFAGKFYSKIFDKGSNI